MDINELLDIEWKTTGPDFNSWYKDFDVFAKILSEFKNESYWTMDRDLKYMDIKIDTRDNAFLLFDRDQNKISPRRVVEAIVRWFKFINSTK